MEAIGSPLCFGIKASVSHFLPLVFLGPSCLSSLDLASEEGAEMLSPLFPRTVIDTWLALLQGTPSEPEGGSEQRLLLL